MDTNKYKAKGTALFRLGPDGIEMSIYDRDNYFKHESQYFSDVNECNAVVDQIYNWQLTKSIYGLFDGKDFLKMVQDGCIIDYDGYIADVFVDGYESNLGLATDNLTSSGFLVSEEIWKDICEEYKVEVNWVNK